MNGKKWTDHLQIKVYAEFFFDIICAVNCAKSKTLVETLKNDILSGKYVSGQAFPSRRALARRFALAGTTVQRALDELAHQGLISRARGSGSMVTKLGASRKIGLIVPGVVYSEFFPPIVSEISRLAQMNNYILIYGDMASVDTRDLNRFVLNMAERLVEEKVAGVICQPVGGSSGSEKVNRSIFAAFDHAGIPVVLIDYDCVKPPRRSRHDVVGINNVDAGRQMAEHLLSVGARKIHFVLHGDPAPTTLNRLSGVMSTVASAYGCMDRHAILKADPDNLSAVRKHLKSYRPDAFVCLNDADAAKLIQTLARIGLSVPEDVLVAGFNDVNVAKLTNPPLTTIHQPCGEIAKTAFDRLLARIREPDLPPMELFLPAQIVVRGSTANAGVMGSRKKKRFSPKVVKQRKDCRS